MISTTSSSAPLFVVFGATGQQGGSVVRHLIASERPYRIRGVTRDPSSSASLELVKEGVEVCKADLKDAGEVKKATEGADYVFGVTMTRFGPDGRSIEAAEGKQIVDAVKAHGIKTLFWSGVPSIAKNSGGKYTKVEMFDVKDDVYDYALEQGISIVDVQPAGFFQNFTGMSAPHKLEDGSFAFTTLLESQDKTYLINTPRDYGGFVVGALEKGVKEGRVRAFGDHVSQQDMADQLSAASGKTIVIETIPAHVMMTIAGEVRTQMQLNAKQFGYYGGAETDSSRELLKIPAQTWKEFCEETDWSKVLV